MSGFGIGRAASAGILIQIVLSFAVIFILALRVFEKKSELFAWVLFTVWPGSTYLQTGKSIEKIAFFAYAGFALLCAFNSR